MSNEKYLVIELDELGDVPTVYFKGQKVMFKEFVNFQWQTRNEYGNSGSTDVIVDYYEKPTRDDVMVNLKSIREGVRG